METNPISQVLNIFKKPGEQIQSELGIPLKYNVMLMRVIDVPSFVYIIVYDSRFPTASLTTGRIRKAKAFKLKRAKKSIFGISLKNMKITPAVSLKSISPSITRQTLFIIYDLAGEYMHDKKVMKENKVFYSIVNLKELEDINE